MKNVTLIVGIVVVVVLLAGAAFFGAQMWYEPEEAVANASGGGRVMEIISDDGNGPFSLRLTFTPAPELPDRPAETSGVFVKREDNSLFVGTGDIEMDVEVDGATGQETVALNHSGPEVEVVVSHDTLIYHDVTKIDVEPSARNSGEQTIQQVVEPAASVDEIGSPARTELQVWGERRGDRVVAAVLVYREAR
jgi:hypothetical protein